MMVPINGRQTIGRVCGEEVNWDISWSVSGTFFGRYSLGRWTKEGPKKERVDGRRGTYFFFFACNYVYESIYSQVFLCVFSLLLLVNMAGVHMDCVCLFIVIYA